MTLVVLMREVPAQAFRTMTLEGGPGNDVLATDAAVRGTQRGGDGRDTLLTYPSAGDKPQLLDGGADKDGIRAWGLAADVIRGGAGNDAIDSTSFKGRGAPDRVSCGAGKDRGTKGRYGIKPKYDKNDRVAKDCERRR